MRLMDHSKQQLKSQKNTKLKEKKQIMAGNHIQFFSKIHIKRTNHLCDIEPLHQLKGEIGTVKQFVQFTN
jgi:hypothetical protein